MGLLHSSQSRMTGDLDQAINHVVQAMQEAGVTISRETLAVKLRRFHDDSPFVDGIFAGPDALGYLIYAPPDMDATEAENFMFHSLDPMPFYQTHCDGDARRLFTGAVLPEFEELPDPVTVIWSAADGVIPVYHGH
jgi:hypothetical protein